jgi:hypothetical protein
MVKQLSFCLALLIAFPGEPKITKEARSGYHSITANDLRAHLSFLASPELEGRETTYRGQKVAARYIASVFQKLNLKPLGANGTYFQPFDLEVTKMSEQTSLSCVTKAGTTTFRFKKDFLTTAIRDTSVTGEVVFIGYADSQMDSAKLAVAAGKITLAMMRMPSQADTGAQRRFRSPFQVVPNSLATLIINDEAVSGTIEQQAARLSGFLDKGTMRLASSTRGGRPRAPVGPVALLISAHAADELLKPAGLTVAQLKEQAGNWTQAISTGATATIDLKLTREIRQSENVLGFLEGSDPKLKEEVVVFSAHYDHVGIGPDGAVFHGADDDGSGTSMILELAEAYVTNPVKPKRSLLFLTVAGEEKGLLGSEYYVSNPAIPLEKTVANLNIDMIGRVDKKYEAMKTDNYVYVIGSDKISTQLDSVLKVANKESENLTLDYQYNDDNDPNQFYRRSDHYNFARNGIPIVFFFTGVHEDYHRPTDTVDKILFDRMARIGRLIYTVGWKVATMPRPFVKDGKPSVYQ